MYTSENENVNRERIELHCHSTFGGCGTMYAGEIMNYFSVQGSPAFAITDESNILSFPEQETVWGTGKYSARPIYGMEMQVSEDDCEYNYSISVLVRNEEGKRNLIGLINDTNTVAKYPVFSIDKLLESRDGLLLGSGVDNGKVYKKALSGASDEEIREILEIYDYAEVIPNLKYEKATKRIIQICADMDKPVVAVSDGRYLDKSGRIACRAIKQYFDLDVDVNDRFFRPTHEMLDAFSYLGDKKAYEIVVDNTYRIAEMCKIVEICPKEKHYPQIDNAKAMLRSICIDTIKEKYDETLIDIAKARLEWELAAIEKNRMSSFLLMTKNLLKKHGLRACDISIRGTGSGSIVVYLLGIGETDPIKYGLEPEFIFALDGWREIYMDINIPAFKQDEVIKGVKKLDGVGKAVRAGTVTTITERTAEEILYEYSIVYEKVIDEGERKKILYMIAGNYKGRGMHPGGMVIFPEGYDYARLMPVADMDNGEEMTYYDYHSIDRAFLKFSLLKHNTPEILMMLSQRCNVDVNEVPTDDPEVLKLFDIKDGSDEMGCGDLPEFRTEHVQNALKVLRPKNFDDIVKVSAIMHGTDTWMNNAEKLAVENGIGIRELIADRDDIFEYLQSLDVERDIAFKIAEAVRKGIVSRGRNARWQEWKKIMLEAGVPHWYIWSCEQIKYLFPRAHAIAYLKMTMRIGWFKLHYPDDFAAVIEEYNS